MVVLRHLRWAALHMIFLPMNCCRWLRPLLLALVMLPLSLQAPAQLSQTDYARVIVKLKSGATVLSSGMLQAQSVGQARPMQRLGQRWGLGVQDGRELAQRLHVAMAAGITSEALAARLARDSDVEFAVVDAWRKPSAVPNDSYYGAASGFVSVGQWYLRTPDSTTPAAINAPGAWNLSTGSGQTVAVLDTGVRFDHPDLSAKLWSPGYNMIAEAVRARTSSGRSADASDLGDWLPLQEIQANPTIYAGCTVQSRSGWHGTEVAGIIGASTNNNMGMAAVAWDARILPVRVLGKCGGWDSDILAGMRWAAGLTVSGVPGNTHPAKVLNLSLGGESSCSDAYKSVIRELATQGVVVVAAAGNSTGLAVDTPANCPGVIAVGGLRHIGTKVGYSALGPEVTISAPSGNCVEALDCLYPILTTTNTGLTVPVADAIGGSTYANQSDRQLVGTSFSAPQVSGAVALMLAARPALTPAAVASLLKVSARPFPISGAVTGTGVCRAPDAVEQIECYCTTTTCGAGMLDVTAAVQAAISDPVAVVQTTPDVPVVRQTLLLSAAGSLPKPGGTSITSYQWNLLDGGGIVSGLVRTVNDDVVTVTPSGPGLFKVRLTVQDNTTDTATIEQWIHVPGPTVVTESIKKASSGGGGGALDAWSVLALLGTLAISLFARQRLKA